MRIIGVFVLLIFAAADDLVRSKISNWLVAGVFCISVFDALCNFGTKEVCEYIGQCVFWMVVLLTLYRMKAFGAGDVKLISVVAAGMEEGTRIFFWMGALACAAIMALWKLRKSKNRKATIPLAVSVCVGYGMALLKKGGWI